MIADRVIMAVNLVGIVACLAGIGFTTSPAAMAMFVVGLCVSAISFACLAMAHRRGI